jgi:hypothetical protein
MVKTPLEVPGFGANSGSSGRILIIWTPPWNFEGLGFAGILHL